MIDGQVRYEVARNWLDRGWPIIVDAALVGTDLAIRTPSSVYGQYNPAGSASAMLPMLVSHYLPHYSAERDRFIFAMVGPVYGAALGGLMVIAYCLLGLTVARAVIWALVCCLATLWWPGSTTVFDQNQHAFWLMLALLLAWQSGRTARLSLSIWAGLVGAILLTYQENYALLLPLVGLAVASIPSEDTSSATLSLRCSIDRATLIRYVTFGVTSSLGLAIILAFNYARFGAPFYEGRYDTFRQFGVSDPIAAGLSLFISPGKGLLFFSPPVLLALVGARRFFERAPTLSLAVAGASLIHCLIIGQLVYFGGDWCWGPRYLLILLPMWALAFPFATAGARRRRWLAGMLVGLGVAVQLLGISLDHQRFFFERNLLPYFWASDQWFYMRHSQLVSRVGEVLSTIQYGVPKEAAFFSPTPRAEVTYSPFGPVRPETGSRWVRNFEMFYLPRPWPLWIFELGPPRRPVEPWPWLLLSGMAMLIGTALTYWAAVARRGGSTGEEARVGSIAGDLPTVPEVRVHLQRHRPVGPRPRWRHAKSKPNADTAYTDAEALNRARYQRLLLALGSCALVAVPFLAVVFPPIADLPQHVAQVRLFWEALQDPDGPYQIQWLTPYGLPYVIVGAAWSLTSPESAGRLAALALAVLWVGATHVLAAARGRPATAAVVASVLVFNHALYWGFYSFVVGWPVFVAWLLLTTGARAHRTGWRDGLGLLLVAVLLYLTHALWLAVGVAWFAVSSAFNRVGVRTALVRFACFAPILSVAALWYPGLAARGFDSPTRWFFTPTARLSFGWLVDALLGGLRGPTEYLVVAGVAAWVGLAFYQHRQALGQSVDRELVLAAAFFVCLVLFLPDLRTNTIAFARRWAPCGAVLLVLAAPLPRWRPMARKAAALGLLVATIVATTAAWVRFERTEYSGLSESLRALPENPRVIGLDFTQDSAIVKGRPFIQTFAYAQVLRGGQLNFSFADFAPSPVVFKDPRRLTWTGGLEWYPTLVRASDLAQFDYALVNADATRQQEFARRFGVTPVTDQGRWRLYRLRAP